MNNMTSFLIYAKTSKMFKALLQQIKFLLIDKTADAVIAYLEMIKDDIENR